MNALQKYIPKLLITSNSKDKGKIVPVLHQAPRHEDVLGHRGTVPHILNLSTR